MNKLDIALMKSLGVPDGVLEYIKEIEKENKQWRASAEYWGENLKRANMEAEISRKELECVFGTFYYNQKAVFGGRPLHFHGDRFVIIPKWLFDQIPKDGDASAPAAKRGE